MKKISVPESEEVRSMTNTSDGGVLITGYTSDGDFNGMNKGNDDIFVINLTKDGEVRWKKTFGSTGDDRSRSIKSTADGGSLVTGSFGSTDGNFEGMKEDHFFVMKLDKNGNVVWNKSFGYDDEFTESVSITTTKGGDILVTGKTSSGDVEREMYRGNIVVMKIDKDGNILWKKFFGGSEEEMGTSIIETSDSGVLVTGYTASNDTDFEGMRKGTGKDLPQVIESRGEFYFQELDVFVIKLDRDGGLLWKKVLGGTGIDVAYSIITTPNGGVLLTGTTCSKDGDFQTKESDFDNGLGYEENRGGGDIFLVDLDKDGTVLRSKVIGGTGEDSGYTITNTADNGVLIMGNTKSDNGTFQRWDEDRVDDFRGLSSYQDTKYGDVFIMKLFGDIGDRFVWWKLVGGDHIDKGYSITSQKDGSIYIAGTTYSNDGPLEGGEAYSIFIVKLDKHGNLKPSGKKKSKKK